MNHPAPMPALRSATRMRHPSPRLQPGFFAMRAARTHRRPRRSRRTRPAAGKSPRRPTPEKPIRPRGNPSEPREAPARPASPTLSVAPGPLRPPEKRKPAPHPANHSGPSTPPFAIHRPHPHRGTALRRTPMPHRSGTPPAPLRHPSNRSVPLATAPHLRRRTAPLRGTSPPPQHPRAATPSRATFSVHEKEP